MKEMSEIANVGQSREFVSVIRAVQNGFIFSVNGNDFVIQGTGNKEEDFESLVSALETAYKKVVR